ncbi:MAG TPA: diguanylate cyclase [Pyrinomonadaceae bacterium]|nr:diguanylate cyclase [Pyrinomonadaceae bacterium]
MGLDEAIERLEETVAELRQASLTDDKTVLGNAMALRLEARQINDGKSPFDLVIFGDLNDFKHLNDEYGHEVGDIAIKTVGEVVARVFIEERAGKAFRRSGDEFVILLRQDFELSIESSVSSFREVSFSHNEKTLTTAMSFGYAVSDQRTSFEDLVERAEVACQMGKILGGGRSVSWTTDLKNNPLVRRTDRCRTCNAKITVHIPQSEAPQNLRFCPCCGKSLVDSG